MKRFELTHYGEVKQIILAKNEDDAINQARDSFSSDDRIRPWKLWDINDQDVLAFRFTADQASSNESILKNV